MTPNAARRIARSGACLSIEFHGISPDPLIRRALSEVMSHDSNVRGFAVTELLARDTEEWLNLSNGTLGVLHDGVDVDAFEQAESQRSHRDRPVVTYAGSLLPNRGVDLVVHAAKECGELDFEIVGGPAERAHELQELARAIGATNITFTGRIPNREVPGRLCHADILVLPMRGTETHTVRHASPLKLFEYMAAGVPIVATDLPSVREVVRNGETACLIEPDNLEALVAGLRRIVEDPGAAARMASNAKREVARFSWKRRAKEMIADWVSAGAAVPDSPNVETSG